LSPNYKPPAEVYFERNELKNIKIYRQDNENAHLNYANIFALTLGRGIVCFTSMAERFKGHLK
jgi:hypothetical protein